MASIEAPLQKEKPFTAPPTLRSAITRPMASCGLWPSSDTQEKTGMGFCLDTVAKEESGEGGSQAL